MINIENLTHSLGGNLVLEDISVTVRSGSVTGLVGINGAGKTTLLRLIAGVYEPDKGSIKIDNRPANDKKVKEEVFFLPDDPYFTQTTTANELFKMYSVFYPAADRETFDKSIEEFGINPNGKLRTFSKGMRRQVFVSIAISLKPALLLLDESFDGLDPLARLKLKKAVNRLVEEFETTVIIAGHSLREFEDFCDEYIMLDNKRIRSGGAIAEAAAKYCKFRLAFNEPKNEEDFSSLPAVSLEIEGKFVKTVLLGDSESMRKRLELMSPLVVEEIDMTFEELFICEAGGKQMQKGGKDDEII